MRKIDIRECDILQAKAVEAGYVLEQLPVGDFVSDEASVCIEHKTAQDFIASICDKRIVEQAKNMAENYEHSYIIITGDIYSVQTGMHPHAILGALASLSVRYPTLKILVTKDFDDLLYLIDKLFTKHADGKKYDLTVDRIGRGGTQIQVNVLMAIPGLGRKKAQALLDQFHGSFQEIVLADEAKLCETKGVGRKLAKNVIEALK